jgi:hypothetical protein
MLGIAPLCRQAAAQPVMRWEIEATIVEVRDPNMIFRNVRTGDPVRGLISFDLSTVGETDGASFGDYTHDRLFQVAGMVIENPRDGSEISFLPNRKELPWVSILNDEEGLSLSLDLFEAIQPVVAPDGYQGDSPEIGVLLLGPGGALDSAGLPTTLELADWTDALIGFGDASVNPNASSVGAQIHTLRPVEPPKIPGDFNASGIVDTADYVVWRNGLGTTYTQADYDTWRANFRAGDPPVTHLPFDPGTTREWTRQLGTATADSAQWGVSADGVGNVYISGRTGGNLGGPSAGEEDAFVAKYDEAGGLLWLRQLGTTKNDSSRDVSTDGLGNVFVSGFTSGSLGGPLTGTSDAFVAKYDAAGKLLWAQQLGATGTGTSSNGVSTDHLGNVYISGSTTGVLDGSNIGGSDAFVAKYSANGNHLWTRQLGSTELDFNTLVSADGLGNVYLAGRTNGSLGGPNEPGDLDAWLAKYTAEGNLEWTRQFGTTKLDTAYGVSADGLGNVYFTGTTRGSLDGPSVGESDAYLAKYDQAGNLLWVRQLGSSSPDHSWDVSADALGNAYIVGHTGDSAGGHNANAFAAMYNAAGNLQWVYQFGTNTNDAATGVSADAHGNVYIVGTTSGNLGGTNAGDADVFLAKLLGGLAGDSSAGKFHPALPEPSAIALLIAACHCWLAQQCRTRRRLPDTRNQTKYGR